MFAENQWRLSGILRGLNGSTPDTATAGATCIIVDSTLASTSLTTGERALDMVWQAGDGPLQSFLHADRAHLPWPVAQLRAEATSGGVSVSWLPCGADIPDNLDLPDPVATRSYRVEAETAGIVSDASVVSEAEYFLTGNHDLVRVAEIGADGRHGAWVSIALGAS